jgi:SAM-dependent methyltransferase
MNRESRFDVNTTGDVLPKCDSDPYGTLHSDHVSYVENILRKFAPKVLLDIGTSTDAPYVKHKAGLCEKFIGINLPTNDTRWAAKLNKYPSNFSYCHADAKCLPFKDGSIDAVTAFGLLGVLDEGVDVTGLGEEEIMRKIEAHERTYPMRVKRVIEETGRVLKEGGVAIFTASHYIPIETQKNFFEKAFSSVEIRGVEQRLIVARRIKS